MINEPTPSKLKTAEPTRTDAIDCLWPHPALNLTDEQVLARFAVVDRRTPMVRVNFISSVDGAATAAGLSGALGVPADKRLFDLLRRLCDVVLVGAATVRAEGYGPMHLDDEAVRWRRRANLPDHPVFAIVSGRLDLDPASTIFTDAPVRPIVVTTASSSPQRRAALAEVADVLLCGKPAAHSASDTSDTPDGSDGSGTSDTPEVLDEQAMLAALAQRGLAQVHCEGGPSLFGALAAAQLVDELCLTVSPMLVAGDAGRIVTGQLPQPRGLGLAHVLRSGDALLLRYTAPTQ